MSSLKERVIGAGGVLAAGAAILASSCCAIPLGLAMLGVGGGAIGLLAPLQAYRVILLVAAALLISAGWFFAIRRRSKRAYVVLAFATLLLLIAVLAPIWEPQLTRLLSELRA